MIRRVGKYYWLDLWVRKKRIRRSLKTSERSLALARAAELSRTFKKDMVMGRSGGSIEEAAPQYLAWAKETKLGSYRTEKYQLGIIQNWLREQAVETFGQLTPYHIEQFRVWIRERDRRTKPKKEENPRPASKATANRYCALLRTFINRAIDWQIYMGPNPVSKVRFYKENGKVTPVSPEDLEKVRAAAREVAASPQSPIQRVIGDLIELSVNTGLRKSEALNLKWRDVSDTEIEIRGKREKIRRIPLNAAAHAVIDQQPKIGGPYIFDVPNRDQVDVLRRTIIRIRKLSKVQHFHFHLCRHYFMSSLLAAGVDLQTIADLMGHSRYMTSLIYAHSTPERRRRAVEVLDTKYGQGPADV
jgi:integrase